MGVLSQRTTTHTVPEEEMTRSWPEELSPTSDLSTSSSIKSDQRPSTSHPVRRWPSSMPLHDIKKKVKPPSSSQEMSTDPAPPEIGLPRDLSSKESRLLSLKAMRESTDPTWLVWESSQCNSKLARALTLTALMAPRPSTSTFKAVLLRSAKTSLSPPTLARPSP